MKSATHKMFALTAGMLLLAAVLGSSLGIAAGQGRRDATGAAVPLVVGQNYTGPLGNQPVTPESWLSCLPAQSWSALYSWDAANQQWKHYFNTARGIPAYVNKAEVGGILTLTPPAGVALIMEVKVDNPFFKDFSYESCP
ncbi:MAG: hypothetical protein HY875_07690 [Chloroflexi bacterium]|nr:hypothetical protein [Chloroflexota bacterium]